MKTLRSFHGKPELKEFYVNRLKEHHKLDQIVQGVHYEDNRGCHIGCTLNEYNHEKYAQEIGVPTQLGCLAEAIFEGLPSEHAPAFSLAFTEALPVGVDLMSVLWKFYVWLLVDAEDGVINYADEQGAKAIKQVADLYQRLLDGGEVTNEQWSTASTALTDRNATWISAEFVALSVVLARNSTWSVALAAEEAAWATTRAAFQKQATKLIELLKEAGKQMNNWNTNLEEAPEQKTLLITVGGRNVVMAYKENNKWKHCYSKILIEMPLAWQPLPEPYKPEIK